MLTRMDGSCMIQVSRQMLVKDFIHYGTLAWTGHACHTGHHSQRNIYIDMLQIVLCRTDNMQKSCRLPSLFWYRNFDPTAQVSTCYGLLTLHDILCGSFCHQISSMLTGSRSDIHNPVRFQHGILIMLHHNQSVAQISQILQCLQQLIIVSLMQTDAWFIQNVSHSNKPGTYLCCQSNALCLSSGQCCCCSWKHQIIQTYINQESQSCTDFLNDLIADQMLLCRQFKLIHKCIQICNRQLCQFTDIPAADSYRQRLFLQTSAATLFTRGNGHEILILLLRQLWTGFSVPTFHILDQAFKSNIINTFTALSAIMNSYFTSACTM